MSDAEFIDQCEKAGLGEIDYLSFRRQVTAAVTAAIKKKFPQIPVDLAVIGHTSSPEYEKLIKTDKDNKIDPVTKAKLYDETTSRNHVDPDHLVFVLYGPD